MLKGTVDRTVGVGDVGVDAVGTGAAGVGAGAGTG
eukprot:CAMPEP_0173205454 /NCGR_PEP_ID=MMETSP1141-20130122/20754_1 /TAXON_ID=483371 /ORGANISM="non described non described, Strain CCMP2298" /LENGTH=34 /DNA_ID= /DNA_START= /DNA_END= /DNA_ORIENTATION=